MKTEILKLNKDDFNPSLLNKPAEILKKGGLVAFPTETVYGLGANLHIPSAMEELARLKNRPEEKHYTIHIADRDEIHKYISSIPPLAQRVISVYWPGPLTVILPASDGGTVGFRLPVNKIARELLRQAEVAVVATSANPSGSNPPSTGEEVLSYLNEKIPFLIDSGPTPLKQSSTVVEFTETSWKILREGIITYHMIKKLIQANILFVCTGNTCRSPMAESIFKKMISEALNVPEHLLSEYGYEISSAGTSASFGDPASVYAREAVKQYGGNLSKHLSRLVDEKILEKADYVYVMTLKHYHYLLENFPKASEKVQLLAPEGISDPFGGDLEEYRQCAAQISKHVANLVALIRPNMMAKK